MLYPRNTEKELSLELFKNPTSEYRGTPFWAWNCKLTEEELLWQMDVMKEMGFGGAHMHARSGLATEYLGEEFMDLVEACVNKAKKEKMLAWLYDEDRWPSGFAGGLVTRDKQYRVRYLLMTVTPYTENEKGELHHNEQNVGKRGGDNSSLLARYDVILDENGYMTSYKKLAYGESAEGKLWYAYIESPRENPRYNRTTSVNTLDKKAIDKFIEVTHEAYKKKIGNEFGKVVPAIFTDEPQHTHKQCVKFAKGNDDIIMPFSDDIEETFKAATGLSLMDSLPEVFWELPDGKVSKIRYLFHDHVAERFANAFSDNIGTWCEENGIALTGHLMHEPTLASQSGAVGECMRNYRHFGIPGIDMLSDRHEYTTAKQTQSAVNQYGREAMLDELYGVTTWDFDFRGHKLYGDWQAALGVTVRVPHLAWLSMEGEAKRDYPASINYQSPWYKEYSYIENHFARVNTAMTRGEPVVKVAVIHPIESFWLRFGPADQTATAREALDKNFSDVTNWLLLGGIDFDYICEATFPEQCAVASNPLKVGKMAYDAVVVPACETLRSTTLERLEAFRQAGGKLIFMGAAPKYENAEPSERAAKLAEKSVKVPIGKGALLEALDDNRVIEMRSASGSLTKDYFYRMRRDGENRWLFLARAKDGYNKDVSTADNITVKVKGKYKATLYDTLTGDIKSEIYRFDGENTVIPVSLQQHDSKLWLLEPSDEECAPAASAEKNAPKELSVPHAVPFTLDEPNALLLDIAARWSLDGGEWQKEEEILRVDTNIRKACGWNPLGNACDQPWYLPRKAPDHTAEVCFEFVSEIEYDGALLALEKSETATIKLNGETVSTETLGYYVDKSIKTVKLPKILKGKNEIYVKYPYGEGSALERMYVLGKFGVRVEGKRSVMIALPEKLAFGDIVPQGLPFYSGKLTYHFNVRTNGGKLSVRTPQYRAALLRATVDHSDSKLIVFSPYTAEFDVSAGEHRVDIDAYINRTNGFGPLHNADDKLDYQSPNSWRSSGDRWCYEYRLAKEGVLVSPKFTEI